LAYLLALDELGPRRSTARRSQARLTAREEHWRRSITSLCSADGCPSDPRRRRRGCRAARDHERRAARPSDDSDVIPARLTVTEVTGSPAERLATIETLIAEPRSSERARRSRPGRRGRRPTARRTWSR
jgi:hypothetical protein